MEYRSEWTLSEKEKAAIAGALAAELHSLRVVAGISQQELSSLVGVSRQTYGEVERGTRQMSWATFLSLVLFFDYNNRTHDRLRQIKPVNGLLVNGFNDSVPQCPAENETEAQSRAGRIVECLDSQALRSIRTMVMIEYARCTAVPGDAVIKAFEGLQTDCAAIREDPVVQKTLQAIKKRGTQK